MVDDLNEYYEELMLAYQEIIDYYKSEEFDIDRELSFSSKVIKINANYQRKNRRMSDIGRDFICMIKGFVKRELK